MALDVIEGKIGMLELSPPVTFEPVGPVTTVFFDDKNQQVFSVRSGGATGVTIKSPHGEPPISLVMADHGPVISIKLNPSNAVLSVQRSKTQVDFLNVASPDIEYSQAAKAKGCNILGFLWTSPTEIVFVTDLGVELYSVTAEKRHVKYLRSSSFPTAWFVSCPKESFLATAQRSEAPCLQVWALRGGSCYKLGSIEGVVREREAAMLSVYNQSYLAISIGEEVHEVRLHKLGPDSVTWSHTLLLQPGPGPLGLQVADNLVLLHSQSEGRSRIYDLQLVAKEPAVEVDGPAQLHPSLPATAICRQDSGHSQPLPYSPSWVVFRPNVLVDARTGHMWRLLLRLEAAQGDPLTTARLLLNREAGKTPLLRLLRSWLPSTLTLATLAQILDHVICALGAHLTQSKPLPPVVIDQPDLFTHLFQGQEDVGVDRLQAVLLELLLCLNRHQVAPRQFLHELLINLSVKSGKFYQLHQILQYGVIGDSKQVACLLLSLEAAYAPAKQLALDMMARLGTATEEMIEIFLAEGRLVSALQLVRANGLVDSVSARKFLEAADKTGDKRVFFTVFSFFEERNLRMRGSGKFSRGEQCDPYVQKFKAMFLDSEDQAL